MITKEQLQDELGFIFVHVPRTAGRSVTLALGCGIDIRHTKMVDYEKIIGIDDLAKRVKYGAVRNPWDRAVSWYLFFNIALGINNGKYDSSTFSKWVVEKCGQKTYWGNQLDNFSYFKNSLGEVAVDKFIQFEEINTDYQVLVSDMSKLGKTDMPANAPVVGKILEDMMMGKRIAAGFVMPKSYQELYTTQESIDAVAGINSEMIDMFGYQFK